MGLHSCRSLASCLSPASRPSFLRRAATGALAIQMALPLSLFGQMSGTQQPAMNQSSGGSKGAGNQQTMQEPGMEDSTRLSEQSAAVKSQTQSGQPLTQDQKYLLILDRFTYGPRPGDLEHLRQIGMSGWFQQQINPWDIDDSALKARLAQFPAMNMPLSKLMELYPSNAMIKASLKHDVGPPSGQAAHAIYADQQEQYRQKENKGKKNAANDSQQVDVTPLPKSPDEILAMDPDERFKAVCHLTLPQLKELRQELGPRRDQLTEGMSPSQIEAVAAFSNPHGVVEAEDVQVKLLRDIYSERQLEEVMVDFWLNHFNVYMKKSQQAPYYIATYERNSIRPFALGKFGDLLRATAMSPAMLNYLDASESVGPHSEFSSNFDSRGRLKKQQPKKASGLNENYAREVMELHTIGVSGGYTQRDVTELAKVFTGWTVGKQRGQDVDAQAQFDASKHEPGDKVVLGVKIKSNGEQEGIQALNMLANSPQCARFISTKLAVRFVSDTPPPAMIDRMTHTFQETHGDIRQVLLSMINSPEFFTQETYQAKVKTPQDFVVSAVRAAGSDVKSAAGLASAISDLGMPLFGMQTPNGYSMKTEAWNNTTALVSRMNFAMALATNRVLGVTTDFNAMLGPNSATMTAEQKTVALENVILHVPVSQKTQDLILSQTAIDARKQAAELRQVSQVNGKGDPLTAVQPGIRRPPGETASLDPQAAVAAGLIFGSPEFQRR